MWWTCLWSLALLTVAGCGETSETPPTANSGLEPRVARARPEPVQTAGAGAGVLEPGLMRSRVAGQWLAPALTASGPATAACDVSDALDFPIEGYGAATVGGWQPGHDVVCVTSLADDGPGTLREATRTGGLPRVVGFAVDGAIPLVTPIDLPSNLTIDGRGHDIRLVGKGFWAHGVDNVILTHLAIEDVFPEGEDGIQIGFPDLPPSTHIVLDHLRFSESGDGGDSAYVDEAISVIFGSHDITIAWCRFERWEKVMLFGNGDAPAALDAGIRVTAHHNFFDSTGRRHPQARYGQFDFYDNYLYDWHMYDHVGPPVWHESFGA
jgi:pectate lyase